MVNRQLSSMKCSVDGCETTVRGATGLCKPHYMSWWRHGDPLKAKRRTGSRVGLNGYRYVWNPTHQLAMSDGYVLEHRMVVHDAGIEIPPGYQVHHMNHDKLDNRLENLAVIEPAQHTREHQRETGTVNNQYGTYPIAATEQERRDVENFRTRERRRVAKTNARTPVVA